MDRKAKAMNLLFDILIGPCKKPKKVGLCFIHKTNRPEINVPQRHRLTGIKKARVGQHYAGIRDSTKFTSDKYFTPYEN